MRNHEEVEGMVVILKARHDALLDRYEYITGVAVLERSVGDKVFMMNGGGYKECRAIEAELNALEWVLENR